jgi:membrane-bound lytic murein transglycosylase D
MHDCFRFWRPVCLVIALFVAVGVFGCASTQNATRIGPSVQTTARAQERMTPLQVQHPVCQDSLMVTYYPPPSRMDFCGEPVPLEHQGVLERFDKEFTLVVYNHAQVYWWIKHKEGYFPWIEERLQRLNLPEDLKYVAVAESEPPLNAPQKRKAVGMRYDLELSPDSALQYLGDLYRTFKSWSLAIAAYNCGERCVMDESRAHGERDFYQMMLPEETERYVFRILAIKAVLRDPTQYGYELPKSTAYP